MNHAELAREACALLRSAPPLRRSGCWGEATAALVRGTALIRLALDELERRRREIVVRTTGPVVFPPRPVVLVVDDEPSVLRLIAVVLEQAGFEAVTVSRGAQAVAACRPDTALALIDVQMPAPWDGPRTLAALRHHHPRLRAAFMSGATGAFTVAELLGFGACKVLAKPFPCLSELVAEVCALAAR